MKSFIKQQKHAFSLVEVTLALGIAAFALVVVLGLFGSFYNRRGETGDRVRVQRAAGSLADYLSKEAGFETVLGWLGDSPEAIVFATYKSDADGTISAGGAYRSGKWSEVSAVDSAMRMAVDGGWVKARIEWDDRPDVNPVTSKPTSADTYDYAYFAVRVKLYAAPTPDYIISADESPQLVIPVVVLR